MESSSQDGDSFEVERGRSRKIWSSVFSVVERGQSQSFGVLVYSVVVTDLNQNPGALTYCFSVEEKDLNQMLFGRPLESSCFLAPKWAFACRLRGGERSESCSYLLFVESDGCGGPSPLWDTVSLEGLSAALLLLALGSSKSGES